MTATEIILNDPESRERRLKQCQIELQYFSRKLFKIYRWMPQKITIYPEREIPNNVVYEIDPEWQKMIDRVKFERDEHIKKHYPEFYPLSA